MTGISRKLKRLRKLYSLPKERPHREDGDTGYQVLHPTKGWQRFSYNRVGVRQTYFPEAKP